MDVDDQEGKRCCRVVPVYVRKILWKGRGDKQFASDCAFPKRAGRSAAAAFQGHCRAQTFGIRTLGTGGLLVLANRRGLIDSVKDRVQRLRDAGLWLSDTVVQLLITEAGE